MKRAILMAVMVLLALGAAPSARAEQPQLTVVLAGGVEDSSITISLSADGRSYVIDSIVPLEVGGDVCWHPEERPNELLCDAVSIGGFEVNAGAGEDFVRIYHYVQIPVTLRGGPGNDRFSGGGGTDKLVGGPGADVLQGYGGNDALFGGPGADRLLGGSGDDSLLGGPSFDLLVGGAGRNKLIQ
jgi:Ca2+-binding RTX toxin-like protein